MNKQEIYDFLHSQNIPFEITEHKAVYNMAELAKIPLPHPEADAKNLFVRDDKRRSYYLLTVFGEKRVDLKAFRREHGTRPLTFASAEDLEALLGLYPGAVTPLGLLNDTACRVKLFIDHDLADGLVGVHPNDNTATVWLSSGELLRVLESCGNPITYVELPGGQG